MSSTLGVVLQVFATLAALGVIACGAIQLNDTGNFEVEWCRHDDTKHCWTRNRNADVAMTFYAISIILLGVASFLGEIRSGIIDRPIGLLILAGLVTVGSARNTGIILGSYAACIGLLQVAIYLVHGSLPKGGNASKTKVPEGYVKLTKAIALTTMVGVAAVGGIALYSVAVKDRHDLDGAELEWCEQTGERYCWLQSRINTYALGAYATTLILLGILGLLGSLGVWDKAKTLRNTGALGLFLIATGLVTLGAAGNAGIVVGAAAIAVGIELMAFEYVFKGDYDRV